MLAAALGVVSCIAVALAVVLVLTHRKLAVARQHVADTAQQLARYQGLADIEAEVAANRQRLDAERQRAQAELEVERQQARSTLETEQQQARQMLSQIQTQISAEQQQHAAWMANASVQQRELEGRVTALAQDLAYLDELAIFEAHGLYESRYDFGTSEAYKKELDRIKERQKQMVKNGTAAFCKTTWTVEGSAAKGQKMIKDKIKLMLRAFNGECDAAVLRVKYNNIESLESKIQRSFAAINKLAEVNQCQISESYLQFRIDELTLTHEYQEKLQAEREEQRQIREQMRDEERARKEIEAAQQAAEAEESKLLKAIEKAREQAEETAGRRHDQLVRKIADLESKLSEAAAAKQRAVSRAQLVRSGHVYVISNIGSFGEHVYKIGMTRRLEPLDRVKELGDASVPFAFDVHAMIYSADAPKLERELHQCFSDHQVNLVNSRKEFFRVSIDQIEAAVKKLHGDISFVRTAAAEEYRKTQALRQHPHVGSSRATAALA